jgi:cysteinyl-tRNA synthetase
VKKEDIVTPYVNAIARFRDQLKEKAGEGPKVIMGLTDSLRDEVLPHLGVRLEDRGKGVDSIWKFAEPEVILKEIEDKIKAKH